MKMKKEQHLQKTLQRAENEKGTIPAAVDTAEDKNEEEEVFLDASETSGDDEDQDEAMILTIL